MWTLLLCSMDKEIFRVAYAVVHQKLEKLYGVSKQWHSSFYKKMILNYFHNSFDTSMRTTSCVCTIYGAQKYK
jgi:hypothetical protein